MLQYVRSCMLLCPEISMLVDVIVCCTIACCCVQSATAACWRFAGAIRTEGRVEGFIQSFSTLSSSVKKTCQTRQIEPETLPRAEQISRAGKEQRRHWHLQVAAREMRVVREQGTGAGLEPVASGGARALHQTLRRPAWTGW
jgi:hypothetical protein